MTRCGCSGLIYKEFLTGSGCMNGVWRGSLLLMLCVVVVMGETDRLVVTFFKASDAVRSIGVIKGVSIIKQYGRRLILWLPYPVTLERDGETVKTMIEGEMGQGVVEGVELDYKVNVAQVSLDVNETIEVSAIEYPELGVNSNLISGLPQERPMWNIDAGEPYGIRAEPVWPITNSTPEVVVAVVDSGLAEAGWDAFLTVGAGYDFISDPLLSLDEDGRDADPTDPGDYGPECPVSSWHGTRVASILAARHDSSYTMGMRGIAQNITLLPVRVLGECRTGYASDVADAIVWAAGGNIIDVESVGQPAKIIAMAFSGLGECPGYLQSAVTQAVNLGAVLIVAAGNNAVDAGQYFPGNCVGTLVVAASTRQGTLATYSNFGETVNVAAPGGDYANAIMTLGVDQTGLGLSVMFGVGTSFAVPHVAGVAALALSTWWDTYRLNFALLNTATKMNGNITFGCVTAEFSTKTITDINTYALNLTSDVFRIGNFSANYNSTVKGEDNGFNPSPACTAGTVLNTNYNTLPGNYILMCTAPNWLCGLLVFFYQGGTSSVPTYIFNGVTIYCCSPSGTYLGASSLVHGNDFDILEPEGVFTFPNPITAFTWSFNGINLPGFGTIGVVQGEIYQTNCPANQYVTGIKGWYGSYLDEVTGICNYLCIPCSAGYFSPSGASCQACSPGYYASTSGAVSCSTCGAGSYSGTGAGSCSTCGAGSYSGAGAGSCSTCGAGKYAGAGAGSCSTCGAGTYSGAGAGSCSTCGAGTYSGAGAGSCSTCGAGTYSVTGAGSCSTCGAGTYSGSGAGGCTSCGVGTWSGIGAGGCTNCLAGYSSSSPFTSCSKCPANQKSAAGGACTNCNAGYYSNSGDSVCTACSPGWSSIAGGACSKCNAGQTSLAGGLCTPCSSGTSSNSGDASCTACPAGQTSSSGGLCSSCPGGQVSTNGVTCTVCAAGKFSASGDTSCTDCLAGTYSSISGVSSCTPCNNGYYCPNTGQISQTQCTATNYCPATGSLSIMITCPAGSCCPVAGTIIPTPCNAGVFCGSTGMKFPTTCTAGGYCPDTGSVGMTAPTPCTNGNYCPAGAITPSPCPAGTYGGGTGLTSSSGCSACPVGTYGVSTGLTSSAGCTACPSGKYNDVATGVTVCQTCATAVNCGNSNYMIPCTASVNTGCGDCTTTGTAPAGAYYTDLKSSSCPFLCNTGFTPVPAVSPTKCCSPCGNGQFASGCTNANSGTCTTCSNTI